MAQVELTIPINEHNLAKNGSSVNVAEADTGLTRCSSQRGPATAETPGFATSGTPPAPGLLAHPLQSATPKVKHLMMK